MMDIGVVMPVWNAEKHIEDAMDSLRRQTIIERADVAIVLDGPQDVVTKTCVQNSGYAYASFKDNLGAHAAINEGHRIILRDSPNIPYLCWISADNVLEPDYLEILVNELRGSGADFVYGPYAREQGVVVDGKWAPRSRRVVFPPVYSPDLLVANVDCYIGAAFAYKREVWQGTPGGHRPGRSHDYDWWLRAEEAGFTGRKIDSKPLVHYRVHPQSVKYTKKEQYNADKYQAEALERRSAG